MWWKKYDIRLRVLMVPESKTLIIVLKDHKNGCVLDFESHKVPPNYKKGAALERWGRRRVRSFLGDCAAMGLEIDEIYQTNAGLFERTRQKLKRALHLS
jgi:hypothetical protein